MSYGGGIRFSTLTILSYIFPLFIVLSVTNLSYMSILRKTATFISVLIVIHFHQGKLIVSSNINSVSKALIIKAALHKPLEYPVVN